MPAPLSRPGRHLLAAALAATTLAALTTLPTTRGAAVPVPRDERAFANRALSATVEGPYAHVATWSLAVPPGAASHRFSADDVAIAADGRLLVADARSRTIAAIDPADGSADFWPRDFPEHDANVVWPTSVVALHRSPAVIVVWTVTDENGWRVEHIVEERRPDGAFVRRLPFQAIELAEDRDSGDVLFWQSGGAAERRSWPSLEVKGTVNLLGEPVVGGLAMIGERIAVVRGEVVRLVEAGTGRQRALIAPADGGNPIAVTADAGHFWMFSRAEQAPFGLDLLRFDTNGAREIVRSAVDLGMRQDGPLWSSSPGFDVVTTPEGHVSFAFTYAHVRSRVFLQPSCAAPSGPCGPPIVLTGGSHVRGRSAQSAAEPISLPVIASAPGGGLIAFIPQSGQLIAVDDGGRVRLLAAIEDTVREIAPDGAGGAVLVVWPVTMTMASTVDVIRFRAEDLVGGRPTASWRVPCDCPFSPQIAADGLQAFLARPTAKQIAIFSLVNGESQGKLVVPTDSGLWPSDVAVTSDGQLWTADAPNAELQGWPSDAIRPTVRWPAGFLASPWRLSAGDAPDGTRIVAVQLADGTIEIHRVDGNTLATFDPQSGGSFEAGSHAVGAGNRIYVVDKRTGGIRLFERVPPPAESPTPAPTPTPRRPTCQLSGGKAAGPPVVVLGRTASVTLTLAADCPPQTRAYGADVVLVIDRSDSMSDGKLDAAVSAATEFTSFLDMRLNRIGLIGFHAQAITIVPLTSNAGAVIAGLQAVLAEGPLGGTRIATAMSAADTLLASSARAEALPVVVLLTDGQSDRAEALTAARTARNRGVRIYTIGLGSGADHDLLAAMAAGRYFPAPTTAELFPIYREVLRLVSTSLSGNVMIDDAIGPDVRYEVGSSVPPAVLNGADLLHWGRSILSPAGITITYAVRPLKVGRLPTNREAVARYTDADGVPRSFVFPVPEILVVAPTPTPTATPIRAFMPLGLTERCAHAQRRVDVALVLDTSTSMSDPAGGGAPGTKLDAATAAARRFVGALRLDLGDQAAVVAFNNRAALVRTLSGDRAAIDRSLDALVLDTQTRPHLGLDVAMGELASARHRANSARVIVLLTDGRANPDPPSLAVQRASRAKAEGIVLFTVALGTDVDTEALRAIASDPGFFFTAVDGAALGGIFTRIAGAIPCSADAFWGRR